MIHIERDSRHSKYWGDLWTLSTSSCLRTSLLSVFNIPQAVVKTRCSKASACVLLMYDLTLAGRVVPKGTFLSISVYGIHHEKSVWGDDADEFVPDRWLTEDVASQKRSKNSYFAFGGGMRSCPGKAFALLEIKCTLIKVFQNFTLELGPKQVCLLECNGIKHPSTPSLLFMSWLLQ